MMKIKIMTVKQNKVLAKLFDNMLKQKSVNTVKKLLSNIS